MADFNSKYSGEQVEQLLDQMANGGTGGGGGEQDLSGYAQVVTYSEDESTGMLGLPKQNTLPVH